MRRGAAAIVVALALTVAGAGPVAAAEPLRAQIESLARSHGFALRGAERIGDETVGAEPQADLDRHLRRLLSDYNFVLSHRDDGRIFELTILGERAAPRPTRSPSDDIHTQRRGAEHYVDAVLTGPGGVTIRERLMLDTGASTLVLPVSRAAALGLGGVRLAPVRVQTANGVINGKQAVLRSVQVGDRVAANVAVTFVDDRHLGGKRLLGMSFLGRFRLTIDAAAGVLRLQERTE